jgi:SAM-dependent methyltransferase
MADLFISSPEGSYRAVNRDAWSQLARQGSDSSMPYGPREFATAKSRLDPYDWIPWPEVRQIMCLASGGGQQAPLFASLGCRVVSADICPEQLDRDRQTARRHGFDIECVEADMLDLAALHGRDFDLVYQAISGCYVPDIRHLYSEVSRVVKTGGYYRVEHWNPVHMQLADDRWWTGRGYELIRSYTADRKHIWQRANPEEGSTTECWHYLHTLTDLIGGLCDAGFRILRFSERGDVDERAAPGTELHAGAFVRPFLTLFAQKL